jgi:hypothetical protein
VWITARVALQLTMEGNMDLDTTNKIFERVMSLEQRVEKLEPGVLAKLWWYIRKLVLLLLFVLLLAPLPPKWRAYAVPSSMEWFVRVQAERAQAEREKMNKELDERMVEMFKEWVQKNGFLFAAYTWREQNPHGPFPGEMKAMRAWEAAGNPQGGWFDKGRTGWLIREYGATADDVATADSGNWPD